MTDGDGRDAGDGGTPYTLELSRGGARRNSPNKDCQRTLKVTAILRRRGAYRSYLKRRRREGH